MKLTWASTASVVLQEEDTCIVFDPFLGIPYQDTERKAELFHKADAVYITHGHFDHIAHLHRIYDSWPVPVYCTKTPYETLSDRPGLNLQCIGPDEEYETGPFHIHTYPSVHCRFDSGIIRKRLLSKSVLSPQLYRLLKLNRQYKENNEILFYDIHVKDLHIQLLGSMGLREDIEYPVNADILIMALQGRSDQDEYALRFIERLKPKTVVLDHYDNAFAPMTDEVDPSGFVNNCMNRYGIRCIPLIPLKTYCQEDFLYDR